MRKPQVEQGRKKPWEQSLVHLMELPKSDAERIHWNIIEESEGKCHKRWRSEAGSRWEEHSLGSEIARESLDESGIDW